MSFSRLGRTVFRYVCRSFEVLKEAPYTYTSQTKTIHHHYGQHGALLPSANPTRSRFLPSSLARMAYQGFISGRANLITNYGSIFKGQAIHRLLRKGEVQGSLFAFLGFVCSADLNVKPNQCREEEDFQRLYQWMQQGLQSSQNEDNSSKQDHNSLKLADYEVTERLGRPSCNSAVYKATRNDEKLAIKLFFNFHSTSKSADLTREFSKEQEVLGICPGEDEPRSKDSQYINVTPHCNILPVLHSFVDCVPCLQDAKDSYPAALPSRHDASGFGRNRTMFTVMPRMDCTVEEHLASHCLNTPTSTLLLLQLLNGITHLNSLGIAHRDLKTDNLLLDMSCQGYPRLVICDFGCCLAEKRLGLCLPFLTKETDRGGNIMLMAPEVVTAQPGDREVIDYSKADAWAAGAIAYELFGEPNPFGHERLDSSSYAEADLPHLVNAPGTVRWVIANLLRCDQRYRLSARQAATILHVFHFSPAWWLRDQFLVTQGDILRWLLVSSTRMLAISREPQREELSVEQMLQHTFLRRTRIEEVVDAVAVIRSIQENCQEKVFTFRIPSTELQYC